MFTLLLKSRLQGDVPKTPAFVPSGTRQEGGRKQNIHLHVEGAGLRSISRLVGVSTNTVSRLLFDCGSAGRTHHAAVVRGLRDRRVELDELWTFLYARAHNVPRAKAPPPEAGDLWTWTALDPDSRLILSWEVGDRGVETARALLRDLALRVEGRVQVTTDGHTAYLPAIEEALGADADYAKLVKVTGPGTVQVVLGNPQGPFTTSLVERHNRTIREALRRYTRKTSGHSKDIRHHRAALAVFMTHYNFVREHSSLGTTPAVAAGLAERPMSLEWPVRLAG